MGKGRVEDITKVAKDALYITVGLGVIAFQKAQVQRRELGNQLRGQADGARSQLGSVTKLVDERVQSVEDRLDVLEDRLESLLDGIEERLPEQARDLAKQVRQAAKDARGQLREIVRRPA
jgi:hypothetical protein